MVCIKNKIFTIDRDKALEIMWKAESIYDEKWYCNYYLVKDFMTKQDWAIIAPYFDHNNYRADQVIELLKTTKTLF